MWKLFITSSLRKRDGFHDSLDQKQREQNEQIASDRRAQVGTGDRSERIRTYNYPQGRITDHRIGHTVHSLDSFLNGDIGDMIDALITADTAEKLKNGNL